MSDTPTIMTWILYGLILFFGTGGYTVSKLLKYWIETGKHKEIVTFFYKLFLLLVVVVAGYSAKVILF